MIVWLASYPRSGNTLLRTVLSECFGLPSTTDEPEPIEAAYATGMIGGLASPDDWVRFYVEATASSTLHLIKTHLPPRDDQRAIYVVRDGRSAVVSYYHFNRTYHPAEAPSLLELALGGGHYGGWADHCKTWFGRAGTLVVRFEDLVHGDPPTLNRIATQICHTGSIRPWVNPFASLRLAVPEFFREGALQFNRPSIWTDLVDEAFFASNGDVMQQLGYAAASHRPRTAASEVITLALSLIKGHRDLQTVCDNRQAVIEELHRACRDRLEVIEGQSEEINRLRRVCDERLALIEERAGNAA
jgi:sulfotransferase family protein